MNIWRRFVADGLTPLASPDDTLTIAGTPAPVDKPADPPADAAAPKADAPKTDAPATTDPPADSGTSKDGDKPKAPDAYTLTIPDDAKDLLGDEDLEFIKAAGKANDWTNEEAQAEVDGILARTAARLEKQRDAWLAETSADKVYGGDKLTETTELARKAVNHLRPEGHPRRDAFLRLLNRGGIGNHIEVVSVLADLGKLLSEDAPALGGGKEKTPPVLPDAVVMFPSSAPKE